MEGIYCPNDELTCSGEQQEFVQPEEHRYGAQQHGGQYGAQENGGRSPNIEDTPSIIAVLDAKYRPSQNPSPSTIPSIPHWTDLLKVTPPANAGPATIYDRITVNAPIPVYAPRGSTFPTLGGKKGNYFMPPQHEAPPLHRAPLVPRAPPVQTAPPVKARVSRRMKKPHQKASQRLHALPEGAQGVCGGGAGCEEVNKILSKQYKSLSAKKKEKYTARAQDESNLHSIRNPC